MMAAYKVETCHMEREGDSGIESYLEERLREGWELVSSHMWSEPTKMVKFIFRNTDRSG